MKLAQIENGLSYAGATRNRNYDSRACCPKPKVTRANPTYGQLLAENALYKKTLRTACRMLVADEFVKSGVNPK